MRAEKALRIRGFARALAYLNEHDPNHETAERIFGKLRRGEIRVEISSLSLIEMELIYRSEKREDRLLKDAHANHSTSSL
ncbi:MAG: hypothetical protein FGF53_05325 [Candidatus Brockarchaeota archaeon]|nr:hypothetical protein [Candidatus Brockarchaeota archaeon]MBO3808782.1 hypothetical protein [Candidatus Brockarchaeota archaeon]